MVHPPEWFWVLLRWTGRSRWSVAIWCAAVSVLAVALVGGIAFTLGAGRGDPADYSLSLGIVAAALLVFWFGAGLASLVHERSARRQAAVLGLRALAEYREAALPSWLRRWTSRKEGAAAIALRLRALALSLAASDGPDANSVRLLVAESHGSRLALEVAIQALRMEKADLPHRDTALALLEQAATVRRSA